MLIKLVKVSVYLFALFKVLTAVVVAYFVQEYLPTLLADMPAEELQTTLMILGVTPADLRVSWFEVALYSMYSFAIAVGIGFALNFLNSKIQPKLTALYEKAPALRWII